MLFRRGSGGAAAEAMDFLEASMSIDQTFSAANTTVVFDTVVRSSGSLTVDASGNFSGFTANKTYLLLADIFHTDASSHRIPWCWYDQTNTALIGSAGVSVSASLASTAGYGKLAMAVVKPVSAITVEVRATATPSGGGDATIEADNGTWGEHLSAAYILQIPS